MKKYFVRLVGGIMIAAVILGTTSCRRLLFTQTNVSTFAVVAYQDGEHWIFDTHGAGLVNLSGDVYESGKIGYFKCSDCLVAAIDIGEGKHYVAILPDSNEKLGVVYPLPGSAKALDFEQMLRGSYGVSLPTSWKDMLADPDDFIAHRGGWN